ncbi:MAG: cellulose biosynthesis protein CelD, partial [Planctomycetota bacterium]|nr:cellulose biosynthesis protein CelD [Planctomycetota bacterium]
TVLAGGTDGRFQRVAKVISLQHLTWACRQRVESVDFLCGSFGWKDRFHLTPRPLYQIKIAQGQICHAAHTLAEAVGDVA